MSVFFISVCVNAFWYENVDLPALFSLSVRVSKRRRWTLWQPWRRKLCMEPSPGQKNKNSIRQAYRWIVVSLQDSGWEESKTKNSTQALSWIYSGILHLCRGPNPRTMGNSASSQFSATRPPVRGQTLAWQQDAGPASHACDERSLFVSLQNIFLGSLVSWEVSLLEENPGQVYLHF